MGAQKEKFSYRINEEITAREVRVVGDGFEPLILPIDKAIALANEKNLDLVEISPQANPPVCRIMDYSKFLFERRKKEKEIKAKTFQMVVKVIRLGFNIDEHDFNFKLKHAQRFLEEGNKVRVEIIYKGRTIVYKEQGEFQLLKFADALSDIAKVEQLPKLQGKVMSMILAPKINKKK
ncbi:MAG TPA: translation initiation factor IF-3 [Bacteroidales bacterium]|nr:translation initiation factor IF-3 [Bacteroidales bacterium]